jgi:hypothetical protein
MKPIIQPIDRAILEAELTPEVFVRHTNKGNNEIYIITHHNAPNVMREIGRLREVSFRHSGGGTGEELDVDHYDTDVVCYEQLIVYNREDQEIVGGYRFIEMQKALSMDGKISVSTAAYFDFSEKFVAEYIPKTIELGRSWVQPNYQPSINPRKGIFALDNIWDGLGAISVMRDMDYFFGKVTMYADFNKSARDFLLYFMQKYFPDTENLMRPKVEKGFFGPTDEYKELLEGLDFKEGFKTLNQYVRNLNENIPPLFNIYMGLSPTMKTFGTTDNHDFGNVEETGILVTVADIYPEKKERHISSFTNSQIV